MRLKGCNAWIAAGTLLVGCSGAPAPAAAGPYAADLRQARDQADSDFERAVFDDGQITRSEYVEAIQRYVRCMHDHGSDIEAQDSGYGYFTYAQTKTDTMESVDALCRKGTIRLIEPIYTGLIMNPQKASFPDLIAECLVRRKAAPAGYSGSDYQRDSDKNYQGAPYNPDEQKVQSCLANPSRP